MISNFSMVSNPREIVAYHEPYSRLQWRAKAEDALQRNSDMASLFHGIDGPALIDAVAKRGGPERAQQRLNEITLSLPYYDANAIRNAIAMMRLKDLSAIGHIMSQIQYRDSPFIEEHLLPVTSKFGFYSLGNDEKDFVSKNFNSLDEYFCIKSLAFFGIDLSQLDRQYFIKYYKMKMWLFINDFLHPSKSEMKLLSVDTQAKVCIVGITVPNIILAIKFRRLGCTVQIIEDSVGNLQKWEFGFTADAIRIGMGSQVQIERLTEILKSEINLLKETEISIESLHEKKVAWDEEENQKTETNIWLEKYEKLFISLFEEILRQYPSNAEKVLWDELNLKIISFNSNSRLKNRVEYGIHERVDVGAMKAFYDRVLLIHSIKDTKTARVSDLFQFIVSSSQEKVRQGRNKIKMAFQQSPFLIKSQRIQQISQLLSSSEGLINKKCTLENLQWKQNKWRAAMKDRIDGNFHLQEFDFVVCNQEKESSIVQQFISCSSIYCYFKFKEKVSFRPQLSSTLASNYSFNSSPFGIIHFYLLSPYKVIAFMNTSNQAMTVDYYKQIGTILISQVLKKAVKIDLPVHSSNQFLTSYRVYLAEEEQGLINRILISQQSQNMYLNLPIFNPFAGKSFMQSSMSINNRILYCILQKISSIDIKSFQNQMMETSQQPKEQKESQSSLNVFGFQSQLVKRWESIASEIYKEARQFQTAMVPTMNMITPLMVHHSSTTQLFFTNMGIPLEYKSKVTLINFVSLRLSQSLIQRKVSLFYQTCIKYEGELVYFIIELSENLELGIFLFHRNIDVLMKAIKELSGDLEVKNGDLKVNLESIYIFPSFLANQVRKYNSQLLSSDEILKEKVKIIKEFKLGLLKNEKVLFTALGQQDLNQLAHQIFKTVSDFIKYYCEVYQLKNYSLSDIFMGKINFLYIMWQISGFDPNFTNEKAMQMEMDEESRTCLQRLNELTSQIQSQYYLKVTKAEISRRFISGFKKEKQFKFYTFKYGDKDLISSPKASLQSESLMKSLIYQLLVQEVSPQKIVRELEQMIIGEMKLFVKILQMKHSSLQSQLNLFLYVLMTRMIPQSRDQMSERQPDMSILKSLDGWENLTDGSEVERMMEEGDWASFDNEFIIARQ